MDGLFLGCDAKVLKNMLCVSLPEKPVWFATTWCASLCFIIMQFYVYSYLVLNNVGTSEIAQK